MEATSPSFGPNVSAPSYNEPFYAGIPDTIFAASLWYSRYKPVIEIIFTILVYMPYLIPTAINVPKPNHAKGRNLPHYILIVHTIASILEIVHYYAALASLGVPRPPTNFEIVLCVIQALTSYRLIKSGNSGKVPITRATFQMMATQRLFATLMSAWTGDGAWNKASLKVLDNFIWMRHWLFRGGALQGMSTRPGRFTTGAPLVHIFCLWLGDYPQGIPVYLVGTMVLMRVNKLVSERLENGKAGWISRTLDQLGLATGPEVPAVPPQAEAEVKKEQ